MECKRGRAYMVVRKSSPKESVSRVLNDISATRSRDELLKVFVLVTILCKSSISVDDGLLDGAVEEDTCRHLIALAWPL